MSIQTFIPEVWAAMLLTSLKKNLVYAQAPVVNRNFEGEIAEAGDTVTINSVGRPTIGDYVPNSTVITPEKLTTAQRKLVITESKYFAFEVDDVDMRQARGNVIPEALTEASFGLRDIADLHVAALHTGVQTANAIGTEAANTADLAYSLLVQLKVVLDEADVPTEGRWVVVPPFFHGLLLENNKFVDSSSLSDVARAGLLNGQVGRAAGFDILMSNNTPNPTDDHRVVMAGYPGAITYAEQINKVEAYRPESSFSDAMKGLHLYGSKLVRPQGIATVVANPTP